MTPRSFPPSPISGAPLLDAAPPEPDELAARYEIGGLLGRGGMGEVHVAWDRRLRREVAMKSTAGLRPDEEARLAREAALTARLQHPGIVAVHDVGTTPDGRTCYTMPVLRGRSLADALEDTPGLTDRLRLVRHLVDVAQAMAWAHHNGIVHRDLKPANVMVGAFGETVVTDWGVALDLREPAAAGPRGVVGTPGYMSPETLDGGPVDGRADQYAVGAILHELLTGAPPGASGCLAAEPPELAAVAARALADDPAGRYPDMRALADDLSAWFEGRRVAAHRYTPRELLLRLLAAWRAPLAVAAVATVLLVAAVAYGWVSTMVEVRRAVRAEGAAARAARASQESLTEALVAHARNAAREGHRRDAELLAARALTLAESPDARGVLAAFGDRPTLRLTHRTPLPAGRVYALSPDLARVAVLHAGRATLHDVDTGAMIAEAPGAWLQVGFGGGGVMLLISEDGSSHYAWDGASPPRRFSTGGFGAARLWPGTRPGLLWTTAHGMVATLDLETGAWSRLGLCDPVRWDGVAAVYASGGIALAACRDGVILRGEGGFDAPRRWATLDPAFGVPVTLAVDGDRLYVAGATGQLLTGPADALRPFGPTPIGQVWSDLRAVPGRLAALTDDGRIDVWAVDGEAPIALGQLRVPGATIGWRDPAHLLVVGSGRAEVWEVPSPARPHSIPVDSGVAAVDISPDGALVAAALGGGAFDVFQRQDGARVAHLAWHPEVAKDVAFSPDGRSLATASSGDGGQRVYDTATWTHRPFGLGERLRRVAWWGEHLVVLPYTYPPYTTRDHVALPAIEESVDVATAAPLVAGLTRYDAVWWLSGDEARQFPVGAASRAIAALPDRLYVGDDRGITALTLDGEPVDRIPTPFGLLDLAVTSAGWLGAAFRDGTLQVWRVDDHALIARIDAHPGRRATLAFSDDGRWLVSGGWDARVAVWSLDELQTPPDVLRERVEARWGARLDEISGPTR